MVTPLCNLMKSHGSDKGADWHNYTIVYFELFKDVVVSTKNLFELGIGSVNPRINSHMKNTYKPGGSLRGWREFFTNAQIYAADIDKDILQPEERITKFYVDQTNPAVINKMWEEVGSINFDIMIDDGLHTYSANNTFFEHSYKYLTNNGIFIIEDIPTIELNQFRTELAAYAVGLGFTTRLMQLKHNSNKTDNNLMIITKNQTYIDIIDSLPAELFL